MVVVPLSTVMSTSPRLLMPMELTASMRSVAEPVSVVRESASMRPEVLSSRSLRTAAVSVVSVRVTS